MTGRIEAIRALERIATASDPPSASPEQSWRTDEGEPQLPTDVRAVMAVLGRRDTARDRSSVRLDLAGTDLRQLVLRRDEGQFRRADLSKAHLEGADLSGVCLEEADLSGVHLNDADLSGARLRSSNLTEANLDRADLTGANLKNASLMGAHLAHANLASAHAEGADFLGAEFGGALLSGVNLAAVKHGRAADFEDAICDPATAWPNGSDAAAHGALLAATEATARALFLLQSRDLSARVGAIHALEGIARDSLVEQPTIVTELARWIRKRAPRRPAGPATCATRRPRTGQHELAPDVQAALSVLGRRVHGEVGPLLDLSHTELGGADLRHADLQGANLEATNLESANLSSANFNGANLRGACLARADLENATFEDAEAADADLGATGSHLRETPDRSSARVVRD